MKTLYNKEYDRLEIYFDKNKKVDSEYWQGIWEEDLVLSKLNYKKNTYVSKITKKYLPSNSKVLEAGCGLGQFVYSLKKNNYDSYGIDYANKTVKLINKNFPKLNVKYGDVENIPFEKNFFDGVWSIGLIEHFYYDNEKFLSEASRVIKVGGYFFLSFPNISLLNRLKIFFKNYKTVNSKKNPYIKNFYQFKLNDKLLINKLNNYNLQFIKKIKSDGLKGLKDEIALTHNFFSFIYNSNNIFCNILEKAINIIASPFSNHVILLILKKNEKKN